jgi:hypothetical protein
VFKPPDLLTLSKGYVRRDMSRLTRVDNQIGKAQANARYKACRISNLPMLTASHFNTTGWFKSICVPDPF